MVNALGWVQIRDPGSLVTRRNSLTVPLSIQGILFLSRKRYQALLRPSKKKTHVSRPDFYKKESGRAVFLLFIISYCMLSLHIITFPRGMLELLGQILIKRNIRY